MMMAQPGQPVMAQPMQQPPPMQLMQVQVPQGLQGGMMMQVQTPAGMMQVQVPPGLQPGQIFQMQVPMAAPRPVQAQPMQQQQPQMMMPQQPQQQTIVVQQPQQQVVHHHHGGGYGYGYHDGSDGMVGGLVGGMMIGAMMDGGDEGWGHDEGWGDDDGGWGGDDGVSIGWKCGLPWFEESAPNASLDHSRLGACLSDPIQQPKGFLWPRELASACAQRGELASSSICIPHVRQVAGAATTAGGTEARGAMRDAEAEGLSRSPSRGNFLKTPRHCYRLVFSVRGRRELARRRADVERRAGFGFCHTALCVSS